MSSKLTIDTEKPGTNFIPRDLYVSEDLARLEREKLWPRVWQMACRVEQIPNHGDFVNYEIAGESILVARVGENEIKAFHNVCQHRGRRLRMEPKGNLGKGFYCPYHAWRYDLDGKLVDYPGRNRDWEGCKWFKEEELTIPQVQVDTWAGWVWITLDPDAPELREYLGEVPEYLDVFEFENARLTWWKTLHVSVNWKVVLDAFCEGYHSIGTHSQFTRFGAFAWPGTNHGDHSTHVTTFIPPESNDASQPSNFARLNYEMTEELHGTLFALASDTALAAAKRATEELPAGTGGHEVMVKFREFQKEIVEASGAAWPKGLNHETIEHAGTIWAIFPHSHVLPSPDGVLWYRFRPNGLEPNSCVFDIFRLDRYAPGTEPEVKQEIYTNLEDFKGVNPFLEQDFSNLVAVQLGMQSSGWRGATLNPPQESMVANWHRAYRDYLFGKE